MAADCWNFNFLPPNQASYTQAETFHALVASTAANKHCDAVKSTFTDCRAKPYGRFVEPESCRNHAEALIQCYHDVRAVPPACKSSFDNVMSCLNAGNTCKTQMDGYLECSHPAAAKYAKYGQ